jgi:hypothetical protein
MSSVGVPTDPLSIGWCDLCFSEGRLSRALLTGIPIYIVLLYVPTRGGLGLADDPPTVAAGWALIQAGVH